MTQPPLDRFSEYRDQDLDPVDWDEEDREAEQEEDYEHE